MKILYLCHRFPYPPRRGGKIRPYHMICHLSQTHQVTVASLVRSAQEAAEAKGIAPYSAHYELGRVYDGVQTLRMLADLPTEKPSPVGYFYPSDLAHRIGGLLVRQRL